MRPLVVHRPARITGSLYESAHRAQKMSAYYRGLLVKREILPSPLSYVATTLVLSPLYVDFANTAI